MRQGRRVQAGCEGQPEVWRAHAAGQQTLVPFLAMSAGMCGRRWSSSGDERWHVRLSCRSACCRHTAVEMSAVPSLCAPVLLLGGPLLLAGCR